MTHHHFSDEEITAAPPWLAHEMELLNDSKYYLASGRQFIIMAWVGTIIGWIVGFGLDKFWLSMAAYASGLLSNLVAYHYAKKAKAVLRTSRYKDEP